MTSKVNASRQQSYAYTYNLQNRLASATLSRMEGSTLVDITSAYVYNQSGIRVSANSTTSVNGATGQTSNRTYLLDSGFTGYSQVFEETVNGTLAKSYTFGDDVLSQISSDGVRYFGYDGHGSTRLLTDSSGAVTDRYDYDAYGVNLFSVNATSPATTDLLYSGEQFDPNLQQQYLRARYYDQNNGTFNRLDPYSGNNHDPQSLHKYAYCHGNPVNATDPTGNMTLNNMLFNVSVYAYLVVSSIHPAILAIGTAAFSVLFGDYFEWVPPGTPGPFDKIGQYGPKIRKLAANGLIKTQSYTSFRGISKIFGKTVDDFLYPFFAGAGRGRFTRNGSKVLYTSGKLSTSKRELLHYANERMTGSGLKVSYKGLFKKYYWSTLTGTGRTLDLTDPRVRDILRVSLSQLTDPTTGGTNLTRQLGKDILESGLVDIIVVPSARHEGGVNIIYLSRGVINSVDVFK